MGGHQETARRINETITMKTSRIAAITFFFITFGLSSAANFETPGNSKAGQILPAEWIRGNNYEVGDRVPSDGYSFTFTITSPFGTFSAEGESQLAIRLQEIAAITELKKVTSSEAFAKAAGGAVLKPIQSTANFVQNPEETVKGIPGGVKRKFENIGRLAKRGAKKVTEDEEIDPSEEQSGESQSQESTTAVVTKSVLGVTAAYRKWAEKVGADPYSTNPVLQQELDRLAKYDAAGRLSSNAVRPKIQGVETVARVNNLVWSKDPYELQKLNEQQLKEMGIDPELAAKFLSHKSYTVTYQTQVISSLSSLGKVPGQANFLRAALRAKESNDALFYCASAAILEKIHRSGMPISSFLSHPRIALANSGKKLIVVLPADRLFWTASFASAVEKFSSQYQTDLKNSSEKHLLLSGEATVQAKTDLKKLGWIVHENALSPFSKGK